MKDAFKDVVLFIVPRILGLGNRVSGDKTYGCFDRYFWHYNLIDFPNARFQEAALFLSLLYKEDFEGNVYHRNPKVLSWISGSLKFWTQIQHKNGSFDEAYPNEYSFVATAFTTYAATESKLVGKGDIDIDLDSYVKKAGDWLLKYTNRDVANQIAGSIAALYNLYLLSGSQKYKIGCDKKIEEILSLQDKDGFFYEYGGFDIGYLTIALSYLADYYKKSNDKRLKRPLLDALNFVRKHVRDDGTFDCSKTSRKTQYLYPYGVAILGGQDVIDKCIVGLKNNKLLNPLWLDDRFCIPMAVDYLKTYIFLKRGK